MKNKFVIMAILVAALTASAADKGPLLLTLTFDDGTKDHIDVVLPLLSKHGWKGTFNIVTGNVGKKNHLTWDDIRTLQAAGHEIASHTITHPNLVGLLAKGETNEVRRQYRESRAAILRETGKAPRFMCHPGIAWNPAVDALCREEGMLPMSPNRHNFGHGTKAGTPTGIGAKIDGWLAEGRLRQDVLIHGVCPGGGWYPFDSEADFVAFLDEIADRERKGQVKVVPYAQFFGEQQPSLPNEEKAYGELYGNVVDRFQLWPSLAPHETACDRGRYVFDERIKVWRRRDVSCPEVVLLKPREVKSDTLVVMMPGGGYDSQHMGHLVNDVKPILDSGRWVAVLHYRIPRRDGRKIYDAPREDAARAIRLLRANAAKYGYSPKKIGAIGFSAGAHLAAISATSSKDALYPRVDAADDLPANLAFAIPVYPAYVADDGATDVNKNRGDGARILPEFKFDAATPPMFMLHGDDDYYSSMASVLLYTELHKRKIPAQMFIFAHASHGLSDRVNAHGWQLRIVDWLKEMGF